MARKPAPAHPPVAAGVISDRTWRGEQSWNRERIEIHGDRRLRLTVKVDWAYDFQGYASSALWTVAGWVEIQSLPGHELTAKIPYGAKEWPPSAFDGDLAELRRVALAVLGSEVTRG